MGANKNFDFQKCGEILLDIKKIKHKTKSYTYCCAFCNADCDQLKKFTKHLEEKHLKNFEESLEDVPKEKDEKQELEDIFESEDIKLESNLFLEHDEAIAVKDSLCLNIPSCVVMLEKLETNDVTKITQDVNDDPLNNEKMNTIKNKKKSSNKSTISPAVFNKDLKVEETQEKTNELFEPELNIVAKNENAEICEEPLSDHDDNDIEESFSDHNDDDIMEFEDCLNNSDNVDTCDENNSQSDEKNHSDENNHCDENKEEKPKKAKRVYKPKRSKHDTDVSSDDSRDSDFDLEKEIASYKKPVKPKKEKKQKKQKETKEIIIEDKDGDADSLDTKRLMTKCKRIIKPIIPVLIEEYKKYELLWNIENVAFGIKQKRCEAFMKISEEITLQFKTNINFRLINRHLKYLNRLYSTDKKQELICNMENREFKPKSKYYGELSFLKDSQGPFKCTICNEMLDKYDPYCHHMAKHNGTPPFTCPSCKMGFTGFDKFIVHKKRHLSLYNFHCDICGRGYPFQAELDWHYTSHTGEKPFLCSICGEGYRGRQALANHVRRHTNPFPHKCHICNKGFVGLTGLNSHVKIHFNIRDVLCKICNKGFTHSKYLKRHENKFHSMKTFNCKGCKQKFPSEDDLTNHHKICELFINKNIIIKN